MTLFKRNAGFFLFVSLWIFNSSLHAQAVKSPVQSVNIQDGSFIWQRLDIVSSTEIADLLKQQYNLNLKTGTIPGYRLQLYFGSGVQARAHAEKVKSEFNAIYPDSKVYLSFKSPDFIVRAGDFRTRSEVLKVLKSLPANFSNAFIVSDEVFIHTMAVQEVIKKE